MLKQIYSCRSIHASCVLVSVVSKVEKFASVLTVSSTTTLSTVCKHSSACEVSLRGLNAFFIRLFIQEIVTYRCSVLLVFKNLLQFDVIPIYRHLHVLTLVACKNNALPPKPIVTLCFKNEINIRICCLWI